MDPDLERAAGILASTTRVVVLTGAGISTDSGIPDFRGPDGVWTKDPGAEMLSTYDLYVADPEVRRRSWQSRLGSPAWAAQPNAGHRALVELERRGVLDTLITQNIDGLHQAAGSDPTKIVEIHGNNRTTICLACGDRREMSEALERVAGGEEDPSCVAVRGGAPCGGVLKSATISFGQSLVAADLERADLAARRCDLLLAIGTTLSVYPAANVVPVAHRAGADVIILNGEETALDNLASVVLRRDITETLVALLGRGVG